MSFLRVIKTHGMSQDPSEYMRTKTVLSIFERTVVLVGRQKQATARFKWKRLWVERMWPSMG